MIYERQAIAERFRAEGRGRSLEITGEMERELHRINSEAAREAEKIRGDADAEAISIYNPWVLTRSFMRLYVRWRPIRRSVITPP